MLQRIYGTAWADKSPERLSAAPKSAAKRASHRKIGKQLDLYHMQEEAPGMAFWHNDGWTIPRAGGLVRSLNSKSTSIKKLKARS